MRYISLLSIIYLFSCTLSTESELKIVSSTEERAPQNIKLVTTLQGKGKYFILNANTNTLYNTIYIEQNSISQFKEYIIESLEGNKWNKIHKGSNQAHHIVLRFEPRFFNKLRLHITRSEKLPHITNFSLYYDHTLEYKTSQSIVVR